MPVSQPTAARIRRLTMTAVLAALIFLATAYLPRIPFPGGYVHIGDAVIFLAASLLPAPWAMAAGAIGAGLADLLTGYALWAPATVVIKALSALFFTAKKDRMLCRRNLLAIVFAGILCVGGYYLWEVLLTGSFAAPLASIYFNLGQAAANGILYIVIAFVVDYRRLHKR